MNRPFAYGDKVLLLGTSEQVKAGKAKALAIGSFTATDWRASYRAVLVTSSKKTATS